MDWQPISTAPKDATDIILFNADEQVVGAGYWCVFGGVPSFGHFEVVGGNHWQESDCTHWMPLPPAPLSPEGNPHG